ncbi:DUF262 domain-containing protein [Rossellomorea marisflavi]|uniref:DUF262 domain-containing protein n=1 Tax=Rossellomorea marisflavi TaxID=189381 RepID=UPI003F9F895F
MTNHFLSKFVHELQEAPMIVSTMNNKNELLRIQSEIAVLKKSDVTNVVKVDVQRFSVSKLIVLVEDARMYADRYNTLFIELIHPKLKGEYVFQPSFKDVTDLGSSDAFEYLSKQDEDYQIHYSRWIQSIVLGKLSAIEEENKRYQSFLSDKGEVEQRAKRWVEPYKLHSSQRDFSWLLEKAFSPSDRILDPALALNVSPSFQRNLVWSVEKKQDFIDSILRSLPIGAFYINENLNDLTLGEGFGMILWDGKQRLHAIMSFYMDEFQVEYQGQMLYYSQMQNAFNGAIRSTLVTIMTSKYDTLEEIVEAYVMVNSKQVKHTDEDLQKAIQTLSEEKKKIYTF